MKKVKVRVKELLKIIKKNREIHKNAIDEIMIAYREKVIIELDKALQAAKCSKVIITDLNLIRPLNMTHYYDRAIGMLEMSVDEEMEITAEEYNNYVLDKWHWSSVVSSSNSSYCSSSSSTSSATRSYITKLSNED